MSESVGQAAYYCDRCKTHRRFRFVDEEHQSLVEISQSGLVNYSDIHTCENGLLEVNNLSIDTNYNIRSFEKIELPKMVMHYEGVPKPKSRKANDRNLIHISQLPNDIKLHMILRNDMINTDIKLGRFAHRDMIPITVINSDLGFIELEIYPTSLAYTTELEQWFHTLVVILEILPPTSLGLLVETLRYITDNRRRPPSNYDMKFMKTILASHEVYFILEEQENAEHLWEKYSNAFGKEQLVHINRFIRILSENELSPIQAFTSNPRVDMDLISLIYLFHILEDEDIITIEIPGILEA